ncbi:MAG: S-layer homology domain-containing protein [Eubacteriales bacterium]|nr:S-layer homology domain-containing protein [Eubacteriales bacterium]
MPVSNVTVGTVAVKIDKDGSAQVVQKSYHNKGSVTFEAEVGATYQLVDDVGSFDDVKPGDWFKDAVAYTAARTLMQGTGEKRFSPNENTSRGQLVTILYRLEGTPENKTENIFTDVESGKYYTEAVVWANANEIVGGYGDGSFGAEDPVIREQLATILYRYAGAPKTDGILEQFKDAGKAGKYAETALKWAVEKGIMSGKGNGILAPKGTAIRAEIAQMLMNYMNKIG